MPKTDLGDVCGRYVSSRLSKQTDSPLSNDQQSIKHFSTNPSITTEHNQQGNILDEKLFFKSYAKTSLENLSQHYTLIPSETDQTNIMPANNDVLLTAFNNNTTNGTNGTSSSHQYRSTYVSCSNGNTNGNHSLSPPSQSSSSSSSSSTLSSSSSSSSSSSNSSSSLMMHWELLKDRGSGLVNLGNTCFINASLQCLANTPPLVQWLLCNSHNQCCRVKLEKQFCLFCEAERLVKSIHSKNSNSSFSSSVGAATNPNNIARRIREISTTFKVGRQEDASEFLICLIDKIVDGCLRSSQPPERLRPSSGTSYEQLCHSQTIFHDLFGLVLRSRVVCTRCRHTSDTFEVQYTWIVGVRNHTDLRQSLQQFVCRETLSGENLYRCIKCKQLVPAIKRYTLHKASKILLINLKRFEFGKNSHKLSHLVRYPEYLNVTPYMSEETSTDELLNYRLYAVLVHVGASMHSGHYFAYVRSPNNRWYKADDTTMTQCDLNQVLSQHGAYILCYIKETPITDSTANGSPSTTTNATSSTPAATTSKLVYQNGKLNNSEQQSTLSNGIFFTSRQIPVQNHVKQTNGQNGNLKTIASSLTKPAIVTSNSESTNGNNALSTEKRAPIVMRIPKLNYVTNYKPVTLHDKPIINTNITALSSSKLVNKSNSTPIILSTTKNSNYTISPATSLSTVQSTSSPLKLIIKTSTPSSTLNGLASISNSYNHDDDDDDDDDENNDDSLELQQPVAKKARIEESQVSPTVPILAPPSSDPVNTSLSDTNSTSFQRKSLDEQSNTSSSSPTKHKKKKKKKKSHKHHHHHHRNHHHHHRKRSRRDSSRSRSRSRSRSYSPLSSSSLIDDQHRRHRKSKRHHHHKRYSSSSSASPSSREPL